MMVIFFVPTLFITNSTLRIDENVRNLFQPLKMERHKKPINYNKMSFLSANEPIHFEAINSWIAEDNPKPEDPPVTTAIRPVKSTFSVNHLIFFCCRWLWKMISDPIAKIIRVRAPIISSSLSKIKLLTKLLKWFYLLWYYYIKIQNFRRALFPLNNLS